MGPIDDEQVGYQEEKDAATGIPEGLPPAGAGGVALGFGVAQAADRSWWVMITHQAGAMSFTWGLPLDEADRHADGIAAAIRDTAAQGRRDRAGLVLVEATGVNPNGSRRDRRRS